MSCFHSKLKSLFFLLLILNVSFLNAQVVRSVDDVKNVQKADASLYITDESKLLSPSAYNEANQLIGNIREEMGVEIAIVILESIDGQDLQSFAHKILNTWGVGSKNDDNGLVILYVYKPEERGISFEVGYGLEHVLPDALCYMIQKEDMIPYLKAGNPDKAIIEGIKSIEKKLREEYDSTTKSFTVRTPSVWDDKELQLYWTIIKYGFLISYISGFLLMFLITGANIKGGNGRTPVERYLKAELTAKRLFLSLFAILFLPVVLYYKLLWIFVYKKKLSSQMQKCVACHTDNSITLHRTPNEVLPYLTTKESIEQNIGSVSYIAATCRFCNNKEVYGTLKYSPYIQCPNCKGITMRKENTSITPNYIYTTYFCLYCKYTKEDKAPRLSSASSAALGAAIGAVGGFRGGGGSFGGGFGGGRSGGGGATTRF